MQSTKLIALVVILPAVTHAANCPAGYKFKTDLTTKCSGGKWSAKGIKNCEGTCCEKDTLTCAWVTDSDCGTDKYRAKGTTSASQKTWMAIKTTATTKPANCCKAGLTCAAVTAADCQALGGYKKNSETTKKCASPYASYCGATCCMVDPLTCGGAGSLGCAAATQYTPTGAEATVAWKSTVITAANKVAKCCKTKAACSTYTCPAGTKAATGTPKCSTATCTKSDLATCCVVDTAKCGGSSTACTSTAAAPKYKDSTKAGTTFTNFQTDCCTAKPVCTGAVCSAGHKKITAHATTYCDGAIASCKDKLCCVADTTTCGGQTAANLVCAAGGYNPTPIWSADYNAAGTTAASKTSILAKANAHAALTTKAAEAKNLNTNTAAPGCCIKQDTCSEFKAMTTAGLIGGAHNLQPGLFSLLVGLVALASLYMK